MGGFAHRSFGRTPSASELTPERMEEITRCFRSYTYFVNNYCKIYDSVSREWIAFHLWPAQKEALHVFHQNQLVVNLKARQLGISWLALCYALWEFLYRPISAITIFSRREDEAMYLMGSERMRGIFDNLPLWMQAGHEAITDSGHEWVLRNGSAVRAFSTKSGDGYVSTLAIIDEADLQPDLNVLMRSVKPTIQAGGKLFLISRSNKSEPNSEFKTIYRGARAGENGWKHHFIPWFAHPNRDAAWYEAQRRDCLSRTGALDELWEQYPETDDQALSAATLDKRIAPLWIQSCYEQIPPLRQPRAPALPALEVYIAPKPGARYVMGADPAEGNPTSDDSSLTVVDMILGEQCAVFSGKYEPAIFANYIQQISQFYNWCPVMVERNNHGHSVIQWLEEHARGRVRLLLGHDAEAHKQDKKAKRRRKLLKFGWLSSTLGKTILYTVCTEHLRKSANLENPEVGSTKVVHNRTTFEQLSSIEAETLRAPEGDKDDHADAFALAQAGRDQLSKKGQAGVLAIDSVAGKVW
jgi:hypothetical protein